MMITSVLKSQLRRSIASVLTDSCTIEAERVTSDEFGAPANDWQVVASDVACRVITLGTMRSDEKAGEIGGKETIVDVYRLITPAGTALDVGQRITIDSTGEVYDVVDMVDRLTDAVDAQVIITRAR